MAKKSKKKKKSKKSSAKKEKYAKFKKEKPSVLDISMPDLDPEQQKQKQEDEGKIGSFLRFNKNAPPKEVNPRRAKSKR